MIFSKLLHGISARRIAGSLAVIPIVLAGIPGCGTEKDGNNRDAILDTGPDGGDGAGEEPALADLDGDTISDDQEGCHDSGGPVDTDGDGTPDCRDADSDDDTIPDSVEAGRTVSISGPADSDGDGIPDFRDTDSDNNGIPDSVEGMEDRDGDGTPDYADRDNDDDSFTDEEEIGADPANPADSDRDGIPDYMDNDSDDDLISDIQEGHDDSDGDTVPDRRDLDSDGDTLPDAYEAGDDDYDTPPPDSDDDGHPDFRDVDSDNDGLADGWEIRNGLDPCSADTDGDGFDDLTEEGAESDPADPHSTPRTVGNFFFIVDYGRDPEPPEDDIVFTTTLRHADVFFLMDTTGSMGGEIDRLKEDLNTVVIPRISGLIEDTWYGVGGFDDFPVDPYGGEPPAYNDRVFYLLRVVTGSSGEVQAGVDAYATHYGDDCPESAVPALYAVATGIGYTPYLEPQVDCNFTRGEFGYPCFRPGSVPVVIMITDAPFHNGPSSYGTYEGISPAPPTYDETVGAIREKHVKVISIVSDGGCDTETAMAHAERLARDTGAVDAGGEPLVFSISGSGSGLGLQVVEAVQALSGNVPMDLSVTPRDDATDDIDALHFINRITPSVLGGVEDPLHPGFFCERGLATGDADGDTLQDIFVDVTPGTIVCFTLVVNRNDIIEPTEDPQTFKAFLEIVGDGVTILDTRRVVFMIPPHIEGPGVPL